MGVPYGAGGHEHGVTATLVRRLSKNVRLLLRYGHYAYDEKPAAETGTTPFTSSIQVGVTGSERGSLFLSGKSGWSWDKLTKTHRLYYLPWAIRKLKT